MVAARDAVAGRIEPLTWAEVERTADGHHEPVFGPEAALERFATFGDPYAAVLAGESRVPVEPVLAPQG